MALTYSENEELGKPAAPFRLPATDGRTYGLGDFADRKALVVIFMCNHCPYVKAVMERINSLARDYAPKGVAVVGINSNDAVKYPDDSFEAMRAEAESRGFGFPYLFDETQEVARAYGAVCTPDPYVYGRDENGDLVLRYHGRIDDNWKDPAAVTRRDLTAALDAILDGKPVEGEQVPSMGCSIKWK